MLFSSYSFLFVFLPLTLVGFAVAVRYDKQVAVLWLLLASSAFYAVWSFGYLLMLLSLACLNYWIGRKLKGVSGKAFLIAGLAVNLAVLCFFKYADFFGIAIGAALGIDVPLLGLALPLGISFFTFQKIAYLVDSSREKIVDHKLSHFLLFVLFFPQLIAGPIVHPREILPQILSGRLGLHGRNLAVGTTLLTIGLFKKVIVADHMSFYASPVFAAAQAGSTISFAEGWCAALAYTFQIYFDFSGYSDMAIGLARLFGIRMPINFDSPYKSVCIIEFWRRWHITLSRFLRDYIYIPLGGNRCSKSRRYLNLMVAMVLGGLWHGAGWNFIIWGALHGVYLVINHGWRALGDRLFFFRQSTALGRILSWSVTFLAVVLAWVLFRSASLDAAVNMLQGMFVLNGPVVIPDAYQSYVPQAIANWLAPSFKPVPYFYGKEELLWLLAAMIACLMFPNAYQMLRAWSPVLGEISSPRFASISWRPTFSWGAIFGVALGIAILFLGGSSEFLYFRF